jgi:glycosyltransferase involved in cell wall biosynthesis
MAAPVQVGKPRSVAAKGGVVLHLNDCSEVASTLVRALAADGWNAVLVSPTVRPLRGLGHHRSSLRYNGLYFTAERVTLGLRFRACRNPPDLIHIHYGMFGAVGLVAGRPFILHFHGSDLLVDHRRRLYRRLHRRAARAAHACLVSTPDLLRFAADLDVPLTFLPNPILGRTDRPREEEQPTILFAAKLDANKGPRIFLPAALELARGGARVAVLGFGSASAQREEILAAIERSGGRVFRERLPRDQFLAEIERAAVVVGQFGVGAFGMTELDAFERERPVVTHFRFPGAYSSPPVYVEASTSDEIAAAADALIADRVARRRIGTLARQWVSREHSCERVVSLLATIYEAAM